LPALETNALAPPAGSPNPRKNSPHVHFKSDPAKLQHYLDLAVAHPDSVRRDDTMAVDVQYACFAVEALTTAQILWTIVGHQEVWQRSIKAIVRQHRSYLRSGAFMCSDFNPEFVGYLRSLVPDLKCAESTDIE